MQLLCCETNPVLKYERYGITVRVIFKVRKVQFGSLLSISANISETGTSYDQSLYEIHIVNHIWPFSLPDKI